LSEWEKDLITIVHQQAMYFLPQIETRIMNEGWASYWHHQILNSLELPADLHIEFLVHHNQVLSPHLGRINPYHLGFKIWQDIRRRHDEEQEIFNVREIDRDVSFLRRFLTFDLMRELDMFQYEPKDDDLVISEVADEDNWQEVKETLLKSVGMNGVPVIRVEEVDHHGDRALYLRHAADGRELEMEFAAKTLGHLHTLWGRKVHLETILEDQKILLSHDGEELSKQELS
jgi:stage V sporulation protein R